MKSFFLMTCLLLFLSCKNEKDEQKGNPTSTSGNSENRVEENLFLFEENGYKCLKGKLGEKLAITMHLHKTDTVLSGHYYYDKIGLPLEIEGSVDKKGNFKITEYDKHYEKTGRFQGKFTTNDKLEGKWINPKNKKELPFELLVHTDGVAQFTTEIYDKEDCTNRIKYLKNPRSEEDARYSDTICSTIHLELLKVKTGNQLVDDKINKSLVKSLLYLGEQTDILTYLKDFSNLVAEYEYIETESSLGIVTNDKNVLCVYASSYEYSGGAHPNGSLDYHNYDLKTGKEIALKDILKPNFIKDFSPYAEQKLYKEYETEGWMFENDIFQLNNNFAITPGGLLFYFNSYEIAPYAAGRQELFFSYKELEKYILPNGVLHRFKK